MIKALWLFLVGTMVGFSALGQNKPSGNIPPREMLQGEFGEVKMIYELPEKVHYKIYSQLGVFIDSGYAQFIDYTDYDIGTYFIQYGGKRLKFVRDRSPDSSGSPGIPNLILLGILIAISVLGGALLRFYSIRLARSRKEKAGLLANIDDLKDVLANNHADNLLNLPKTKVAKDRIEAAFEGKLNTSDWKIIHQLLADPSISNKALADHVSLSVEGTRSSLKKMYRILEIPSSRNMKLALILKLGQISEEVID